MPFLHASDAGAMVHGKPIIIKMRFFETSETFRIFLVEDDSAPRRRLQMGVFP